MANDFQSQPRCPVCLDNGIVTNYKGDPHLEYDEPCECGILSREQFYQRSIDTLNKPFTSRELTLIKTILK